MVLMLLSIPSQLQYFFFPYYIFLQLHIVFFNYWLICTYAVNFFFVITIKYHYRYHSIVIIIIIFIIIIIIIIITITIHYLSWCTVWYCCSVVDEHSFLPISNMNEEYGIVDQHPLTSLDSVSCTSTPP